jgi:hypothetical protein
VGHPARGKKPPTAEIDSSADKKGPAAPSTREQSSCSLTTVSPSQLECDNFTTTKMDISLPCA